MAPRFGLVAAEASGDLLAAHLLDALRGRWPGLEVFGIGGPHLRERGTDLWWPAERLSVRGYLEVLPRLPALLRMRAELTRRMQGAAPDLFIGVDAPDFNFAVEARLRAAGVRTLHFVSPSFWAWRRGRLQRLRAAADHVLCLFPFEPPLLAAAGIPATYVGHPLAAAIPLVPDQLAARRALALPEGDCVVALLPGSRSAEVGHLLPRFVRAAARIVGVRPHARFILPAVPALRSQIDSLLQRLDEAGVLGQRLQVVTGQSHQALQACDVALVASGTATLEAALCKRPMVIAYAMPRLSHWLMRRHRQLPWVGLPNILCAPPHWLQPAARAQARLIADAADAPFVVPELIQQAATPEALAAAVLDWLAAPQKMSAVRERFTVLHRELMQPTARLAADAIQTLLAA